MTQPILFHNRRPNKPRQPTPGARLAACWSSHARCGCAHRWAISYAMKTCALLFAIITTTFAVVAAPWGSNSIPNSVGWDFHFEGKSYESVLTREALLSGPSWSPEMPLPLSTGNAVAAARKQIAALVSDPSKWSAKEIQLLSANPLGETQHWYYAIHFFYTDRSNPDAPRDYIIACVDFKGRAGTIKLKSK